MNRGTVGSVPLCNLGTYVFETRPQRPGDG
jgi:hypothetical protein